MMIGALGSSLLDTLKDGRPVSSSITCRVGDRRVGFKARDVREENQTSCKDDNITRTV
jgi:hypothetical protein